MGLIDIIFDNLLIILLIIGSLTGLFGRGKKRQENHPRPVANPIELPWEKEAEQEDNRTYSTQDNQAKDNFDQDRPWRKMNEKFQEKFQEKVDKVNQGEISKEQDITLTQNDLGESDISDGVQPVKKKNVSYSPEVKRMLDFKRMNPKSVINGIIWSQVLEKPRSKNPHYTNTRQRYTKY